MTVTALLVVVVFVMELIVLGGSLGFICGEKKGRELFFIYQKKREGRERGMWLTAGEEIEERRE